MLGYLGDNMNRNPASATRIAVFALIIALVSLHSVAIGLSIGQNTKTVRVLIKIDPKIISPSVLSTKIAQLNGKTIYKLSTIPVIVAKVPEALLPYLKNIPGVVRVDLDQPVHVLEDTIPWGVSYIGAPNVWNITKGQADVNGDGIGDVQVAVIDTGVDYNHPDLSKNIAWCIATLNGQITNDCYDGNGHGTHVIGTIAALLDGQGVVGVAPEVKIYAIKALDDNGQGYISDIVAAIDQAIKGPDGVIDKDSDGVVAGDPDDDAPEVISMSLGGSSDVPELHDIIQKAYQLGIVVVAAAGNEGASSPAYPAAYPEVIAVGAIDNNEQVPYWSNRNPEVAAPGVDILSTWPGGEYKTLSGTSMATPHVSATVALMQAARLSHGLPILPPGSFDDMSNTTVRGILHLTAKDLGAAGYDELYGYGAIQADKAVEMAIGSSSSGGGGGSEPAPSPQPPSSGTETQLLNNPDFATDASGWSFYPGDYIDKATWLESFNGASGVVEIYGTLPAWSFDVSDYAFIGQSVTFPQTLSSGTIEVKYYASSSSASMSVVVGIYDTANSQWVWYDIVDATKGSWQSITVTIPSDTLTKISGGTYLFVVGVGASDFTLWWSSDVYFFVDNVYLTVTS
jgi:subtilisin